MKGFLSISPKILLSEKPWGWSINLTLSLVKKKVSSSHFLSCFILYSHHSLFFDSTFILHTDRFPMINSLIQRINIKKRKDTIILAVVIGVCLFLLILWAFWLQETLSRKLDKQLFVNNNACRTTQLRKCSLLRKQRHVVFPLSSCLTKLFINTMKVFLSEDNGLSSQKLIDYTVYVLPKHERISFINWRMTEDIQRSKTKWIGSSDRTPFSTNNWQSFLCWCLEFWWGNYDIKLSVSHDESCEGFLFFMTYHHDISWRHPSILSSPQTIDCWMQIPHFKPSSFWDTWFVFLAEWVRKSLKHE